MKTGENEFFVKTREHLWALARPDENVSKYWCTHEEFSFLCFFSTSKFHMVCIDCKRRFSLKPSNLKIAPL
jgi:hypothetical protein